MCVQSVGSLKLNPTNNCFYFQFQTTNESFFVRLAASTGVLLDTIVKGPSSRRMPKVISLSLFVSGRKELSLSVEQNYVDPEDGGQDLVSNFFAIQMIDVKSVQGPIMDGDFAFGNMTDDRHVFITSYSMGRLYKYNWETKRKVCDARIVLHPAGTTCYRPRLYCTHLF